MISLLRIRPFQVTFALLVFSAVICPLQFRARAQTKALFRAGAAAVDITPEKYPVIVNAMFTQRTADRAQDRLYVRCVVLDDGTNRIAIAVVDSCMVPRDLIDRAKELAHHTTKIPVDRMLISATHTHSAPSAMGCLGSDPDPNYVKFLPGRIAGAIEEAAKNLAAARVGWSVIRDAEHTHNRRWIYRSDKVGTDPFGNRTVRANMHPGYQNPDAIGPSGPVDPGLSVLSIQSPDGRPMALLANYSMHYFGSPLLSADYYGQFATKIGKLIGVNSNAPPFVGIMSQGTSGDLMWMDYGKPKNDLSLEAYSDGVARAAYEAYRQIQYHSWVPLVMRESTLTLGFRVPNDERLAWARKIVDGLKGRLPQSQAEIYAREQIFLHERPTAELKLQAIRIGELGIAAIPNEVFAITGLKIKAQSPLQRTFNIELANGAEGYIPPPEQHHLGGYTTWPARTAGLVPQAEPEIVESVLKLLEQVSGKPRRKLAETHGPYAQLILRSKPVAYWRFSEFRGPTAFDSSGHHNHARFEDGIAFYLEGPQSDSFSGKDTINRCAHFAGGHLEATIKGLGPNYSIEMWFWNGLPTDVRPVTGFLFARGVDGAKWSGSDKLGIGGPEQWGRVTFWAEGSYSRLTAIGRSPREIAPKRWHHLVVSREGQNVAVYLNGNSAPELSCVAEVPFTVRSAEADQLFIGGASQAFSMFEGKIDEVAVYDRALPAKEIAKHYQTSGIEHVGAGN